MNGTPFPSSGKYQHIDNRTFRTFLGFQNPRKLRRRRICTEQREEVFKKGFGRRRHALRFNVFIKESYHTLKTMVLRALLGNIENWT